MFSPQQAGQMECFLAKINLAHVESESEPPSFKLEIDMGGAYGNSLVVTCGLSKQILGEVNVIIDLAL